MERSYHNPYRYALPGLLTEIAAFVAVLVVLVSVGLLAAALVR